VSLVHPLLERLVAPLLRETVDRQVRAAIAEHLTAASHVPPTTCLEQRLVQPVVGEITIEEYALFGHSVSVFTGTHDVTKFDRARQVGVPKTGRDVVIGRGAWVSSNALVLGPCRIGEHAVVAAASVVTADVARHLTRIREQCQTGAPLITGRGRSAWGFHCVDGQAPLGVAATRWVGGLRCRCTGSCSPRWMRCEPSKSR